MANWLKKINLFGIISAMFIGFLALATVNYVVISNYVEKLNTDADEINAAGKTRMLSQRILRLVDRASSSPDAKTQLYQAIDEHDNIFNAFESGGLIISNGIVIDKVNGEQSAILNESIKLWESIKTNITIVIDNSDNDSNPAVQNAKDFLDRKADEFLLSNNRFVESLIEKNNSRLNELYTVLLGFLIFNSTCIIIVLYATKRFIFEPLNNVSETANKLAEGDVGIKLSYPYDNELGSIVSGLNHLSGNLDNAREFIEKIENGDLSEDDDSFDEAALTKQSIEVALLKMRDQMKVRAEEDEIRNWTTQGLAKFVDILRASNDVNQLGDDILSNLTDYTKANQAGLYLINDHDEDNKHLELVALYAFNSKKFEQQSFKFGEGLVGQTFLEKKTMYFLEVPEDYVTITSGLGDANPRSLLLVPLKIESEVYGVLEIASFNEFEEYQIKFIEKLSENIASTLSAVKTNETTKRLLEESQQLTEQMQAQEEEMRQNMEELTATQEEMARKETAINSQIEVINNAVGIIEYSSEGQLISSNAKISSVLGYSEHEMMSLTFHQLHAKTTILDEIKTNREWSGWVELMHSSGNKSAHFAKCFLAEDDNSQLGKIIEIIDLFESGVQVNTNEEADFLSEMEEELRQNLDALDITQEKLTEKLNETDSVLNAVKSVSNVIVYDNNGSILEISDKLKSLKIELENINEVTDEPLETLKTLQNKNINILLNETGEVSASIVKIKKDNKLVFMMVWT